MLLQGGWVTAGGLLQKARVAGGSSYWLAGGLTVNRSNAGLLLDYCNCSAVSVCADRRNDRRVSL